MFSVSQAARRLGVCTKTVRRWDTRSLIRCHRTCGGHRRVTVTEMNRLLGTLHLKALGHPTKKRCAIYARVISHRQKTDGDLDRQLRALTTHCRLNFRTSPLVFTDIGSGLNMRRRGLRRLLNMSQKGVIDRVLITRCDRLDRFGVDLLERLLSDYGVKVAILREEHDRSPQEELVSDMMALIASFSGRVYGLRGASLKRELAHSSS